MRYPVIFTGIALVFSLACQASNDVSANLENRTFLKQQLNRDRARFQVPSSPVVAEPSAIPLPSAENQRFIEQLTMQQQQRMTESKPLPAALVFASFSMPEAELKQRVQEATALGIPVVIRGMVNGDLRQTANAVVKLVKESNKGGVQIDPTAFRTWQVNAVPVLIVTCNGKADRIQGDMVLRQALEKVAHEGECAATARQLLDGEGAK